MVINIIDFFHCHLLEIEINTTYYNLNKSNSEIVFNFAKGFILSTRQNQNLHTILFKLHIVLFSFCIMFCTYEGRSKKQIWWLSLPKRTKESNYTDDAQTVVQYYHWCACLLFALACYNVCIPAFRDIKSMAFLCMMSACCTVLYSYSWISRKLFRASWINKK